MFFLLYFWAQILLTEAVWKGHTDIVRLFIENGPDVKQGGGVRRSINCTCYEELSQSLKAKYFMAVQSFSLLSKTLQEVGNSLYFFLVVSFGKL